MPIKEKVLDVFSEYATDEALEVSGVWRELNSAGAKILVARMGNERFVQVLQETVEAAQATLALGGEVADKAYKDIVLDVMSKTVLLGWVGVAYKGEVHPYSPHIARKMLEHREFRKVVERFSNDLARYRLKVEEEQGNG